MIKIRVGGVPEHFNYVWHWAKNDRAFNARGIEMEWVSFPGGTGAMAKALRNNEIDLAVILTEGIIADIIKGNPSKILKVFVKSPLLWGIHVPAHSDIQSVDQITERKYAISRYGSGSHLMAVLDAELRDKPFENLNFEVVGNLEGARASMGKLATEVFLWEKYTTQPYVLNEEFRRVGIRKTPWPCFVVAGTDAILDSQSRAIKKVLAVVNNYSVKANQGHDELIPIIAKAYELEIAKVKEWIEITKWESKYGLNSLDIEGIQGALKKVGIIDQTVSEEHLLRRL